MHFLLTALGSYGDVLPMVGLGAGLRQRGHEVTLVTNPHFQAIAEQAGLTLVPVGTSEEYDSLVNRPDLWHHLRGPKFILQFTANYLPQLYETLQQHYRPGETVIGAHGLDLASRIFHDKCQAPLATIHFAPLALRTLHDTPNFIGVWTQPPTPRWLKRLQFYIGDRLVIDPVVTRAVNKLRKQLDLAPVSRAYHSWHNSPQLTLCLWPEWYGPQQPDWPASAQLVGFPLWDPNPDATLTDEVLQFLEADAPPIAFAPGSANAQAEKFFQTAVDVCHQLNRRGILLTKYPAQLSPDLPPTVRHFDFVPFSRLLPRVAALVHHGGIGSSAAALAAGIPQLVMPMAYDQLDNATRLERLGVGRFLKPSDFERENVSRELAGLLDNDLVSTACQNYAAQCDGPASIARACGLLESLSAGAPVATIDSGGR